MKDSLLAVAALITINSLTIAQTSKTDFRGFNWGDSLSEIKTDEKAKFVNQDKDDLLSYDDQLAGSDVNVNYQFNDNGKLVSGIYVFFKIYSNPQLYIQDFVKFKKLLTTKYGAPNLSKEEWSSNTEPSDKNNYGQAIADGNLTIYSLWTTDRSVIKITLIRHDNHPSLQIHYAAKTLDELENKEELSKALLKL
jgi:hypothetical protein